MRLYKIGNVAVSGGGVLAGRATQLLGYRHVVSLKSHGLIAVL
jgi:hypothetical protein